MAKEYGEKSLFEKVFGGKLFPKGTGGILPKYDEALNKSKSETSIKNYKSNRAASDMMKAAEKKFDMEKEFETAQSEFDQLEGAENSTEKVKTLSYKQLLSGLAAFSQGAA